MISLVDVIQDSFYHILFCWTVLSFWDALEAAEIMLRIWNFFIFIYVMSGDEIVSGDDMYGGSDRLLSRVVPKSGVVVK